MQTFETKQPGAARVSYVVLPPVAGTVIKSDKVKPHEASKRWHRGDWAHLITIETHSGEHVDLCNSKGYALDIQVGDKIVIGEAFENYGETIMYSNKHTMKITDHGYQAYNKLS